MAAFFDLYPVLSLALALAAVTTVAFVVWGGVDGRRRDREAARPSGLDDLLRTGRHTR